MTRDATNSILSELYETQAFGCKLEVFSHVLKSQYNKLTKSQCLLSWPIFEAALRPNRGRYTSWVEIFVVCRFLSSDYTPLATFCHQDCLKDFFWGLCYEGQFFEAASRPNHGRSSLSHNSEILFLVVRSASITHHWPLLSPLFVAHLHQ